MATPTYEAVALRWYGLAATRGRGKQLVHPHLRGDGDRLINSSGDVMAQVVRERNGDILFFLLNGDGAGNRQRFGNQQWAIRGIVQARTNHYPFAILPFSALEAAGIENDTIVPIEVRPDEWVRERSWFEGFKEKDIVWNPEPAEPIGRYGGNPQQTGTIPSRPELWFRRACYRHSWNSGGWTRIPEPQRDIDVFARPWTQLAPSGKRWFFDRQTHRLGDSVFRAKAHGAYRTYVSSFDYQETNPLYFLAELPWKARPKTVAEAIESLAPPIVQQALRQKRVVRRQGDIFAIPTELTTEQIRERTNGELLRMQGVYGTDHLVTEQFVGRRGVTYARGIIHHKPPGRRPDHRRQYLGSKWHLVVPNAVPRRRAGAMVRG